MNNTKPFDLVRALAGDPVVTRDGRTVQAVYHMKELDGDVNVFAIIGGSYSNHTEDGKAWAEMAHYDLFMATKEVERWIATGDAEWDSKMVWTSCAHLTEINAQSEARVNDIKNVQTHKIIRYE